MKYLSICLLTILPLAGCETSSPPPTTGGVAESDYCPPDVAQADRYKFPGCNAQPSAGSGCPADVSQADRYKYPACN